MGSLIKEMKGWTKRCLQHRADEMVKIWKAEVVKRLEAVGAARIPETAAKSLLPEGSIKHYGKGHRAST